MSSPDGIDLLGGLLLSSAALKQEDRPVVTYVCSQLRIRNEEELGLVNEHIRRQVELEATLVYLLGKYGSLVDRWNLLLEKYRAEKSMDLGSRDDEGLKWTKGAKEQWLLNTDAHYVVLSEASQHATRLLYTLRDLNTLVFSRDGKLEQLSINYRREAEADRRVS